MDTQRKRLFATLFFTLILGIVLIQQIQPETQNAIVVQELRTEKPENSFSQPENEMEKIVVHVAGAVENPGIYTLPIDARVEDAIQKAGIAETADADALNRAATLTDGQKIVVPFAESSHMINQEENQPGVVTGDNKNQRNINLNQATITQLMELPGIGEVKANAIIQYRQEHGSFCTVDELLQVNGIGSVIYGQIAELVCV